MRRFLDATLGKALRHFFFLAVRGYYTLAFNISASGKHLLHDHPNALILATHLSRHDGPLILSLLYTTARVRPVVHYSEYANWLQWFPLFVISAIPVSAPKSWSAEKRSAYKEEQLGVVQ